MCELSPDKNMQAAMTAPLKPRAASASIIEKPRWFMWRDVRPALIRAKILANIWSNIKSLDTLLAKRANKYQARTRKRIVLGKGMSEKDFRDQLLKGFWHDLKQHLIRDAIIVVDSNLDLGHVASQISLDRAAVIQEWITQKLIGKPTLQQVEAWDANPTKEFNVVIVQPYVLIQEITAH